MEHHIADGAVPFAPLVFQVSRVAEELGMRYRVFAMDGSLVTVQAGSAAEAVEKSGIPTPIRVVSLANEQRRLMEGHVLSPAEQTVATSIDLERFVPDFRFLAEQDMPQESSKAAFEAMSFADYAGQARVRPGAMLLHSRDLRLEAPSLIAEEAEEMVVVEEEEEAQPLQEPQEEVVEATDTPHALTEEEVRKLLQEEGKDSAPPTMP